MAPKRYPFYILLVLTILIKLFSLDSYRVEKYYSNGVYPFISAVQRILFGWVPFSVGDIFYAAVIIYLVRSLVKCIRRREFAVKRFLERLLLWILAIYVSFNLLWGLNYNRLSMAQHFGLDPFAYHDSDLVNATQYIVLQMNRFHSKRTEVQSKKQLFSGAVQTYRQSPLYYRHPSVKPSLYSYLGNYLGFTGYYNPFTGEAQINTTVPAFVLPFTTCHEIGHQLGYAKENEANFAGFISCSAATDTAFLYSLYFEMYAYAARHLYVADSNALKRIQKKIAPPVREDMLELREFYRRYATPVETAVDRLYAEYLKANEQPTGKMSYSEVIGLLIAYYKKQKLIP